MRHGLVLCIIALALAPAVASAEPPSNWLSARGTLGLDGDVQVDDTEDDLDRTFGGELISHQRIQDFAAIQGGASAMWWRPEDSDADRNALIDLYIGPMGLVPLTEQLTLYAGGRIGGTVSLIGEDEFFGGDVDPAVGWHFGGRAGALVEVADGAGLEIDVGLTRHMATHEVDTVIGSAEIEGEVTQLLLRAGFSWTLRN